MLLPMDRQARQRLSFDRQPALGVLYLSFGDHVSCERLATNTRRVRFDLSNMRHAL